MFSFSKRVRLAFFSTVLFGIITHMFAMVNECPHADVFSAYFGYGAGYTSGRWGLAFLGDLVNKWFGNYPIPWLNGMLSILFLAVSSVYIIESFDISTEQNCILICMFVVACPSVFSAFAYIFTTPYYCFSIMLTCCGIYFIKKKRNGWILGTLLFTGSLGIYQAYLGLAASIFILFLILDCLDEDVNVASVLIKAWQYFGILCISILLYLGITKVSLKLAGGVSLTSYESIDTMGQLQLGRIPQFIAKSWLEFIAPAIMDRNGLSMFIAVRICYGLLLLLLAFLALRIIIVSGRKEKSKTALMGLFLFLFPCSVNLIYLMCANGYVHTLMRYAQIMIYIGAIVIIDRKGMALLKGKTAKIKNLLTGLCLVTAGSFCVQANQAYYGLHQMFLETKAYYTVLVTQIKSQEGYQEDMPVAFIGEAEDKTFPMFVQYSKFESMAGLDCMSYYQLYSNKGLLKYCCGFAPDYVSDTSSIEAMEEFKKMPSYPDYGSVDILNGMVVVKFQEK